MTDARVRSIDPPAKDRKEHSVPGYRGLRLLVTDKGAKSWIWRGRLKGDPRPIKRTLGTYPAYSLAAAQEWASTVTRHAERGEDIVEIKKAERVAAIEAAKAVEERDSQTLDWFWTQLYEPRYVEPLRDKRETRRMYNKYLKPALGEKPLLDITLDDLDDVIHAVHAHAPVTSNRLATMCKTMWKRGTRELRKHTRLIDNVAVNLYQLHDESTGRDRVLFDEEIGYLYQALDRHAGRTANGTYAAILRLVLDSGCRITEARLATWDEFDFEAAEWRLSPHRMKNHLGFIVPLAAETVAWLRERKAGSNFELVFASTRNPEKAMNGVSKAHEAIRSTMAEIAGDQVESWSAHDLRHTFSTRMNEVAARGDHRMVTERVVEHCLHHIAGANTPAIARRYNHYQYINEKRETLRVWQDRLAAIRLKIAADPPEPCELPATP